jgi:hypothetical protein
MPSPAVRANEGGIMTPNARDSKTMIATGFIDATIIATSGEVNQK